MLYFKEKTRKTAQILEQFNEKHTFNYFMSLLEKVTKFNKVIN